MNNLNALKFALETFLGAGYYYEEAPRDTAYPYRVGQLMASYDDEIAEVWSFELDYWGKKSSALDDMIEADAGDGNRLNPSGLNHRRLAGENLCAFATLESVVNVTDPDTNIRHKRVSYFIRLWR